ncbi:hypothetical protein [Providencia sp.]|uniref:phage tail fiber protein n=1 Tax=Providencia sp. TaxID=589 RepID=UPI001B5E2B56|nr:hypothetical protein [Providencia sp.]MBP6121106.1 hypothetical protein [Providencia sp.]
MYSTGTVTTTANSTKLVGTGTKWLNNINRVSAEQAIQLQIGNTVHNNSIQSIQSDTELTLNFPFPTAAKDAKYAILTTMIHSISDANNKIVAMNISNVQFSDILTRWMTEQGIITVTLPDQTTQQLRTTKEMDKQLDGKFDKAGGKIEGSLTAKSVEAFNANTWIQLDVNTGIARINTQESGKPVRNHIFQDTSGSLMHIGDYGVGIIDGMPVPGDDYNNIQRSGFYAGPGGTVGSANVPPQSSVGNPLYGGAIMVSRSTNEGFLIAAHNNEITYRSKTSGVWRDYLRFYTTANTTKDSNGNLKAASPIIKVFADHIELNDESEGVEMARLGVGHYLIKGVVGFNADGAWGINNGFVIPQDHNGKNMVLIDYDVKPDGNIELFVFHNQNIDMPERFQNKRIKHFDEEGQPVYFDNYEPCDVPESRWIDMRVEMPPNSLYNQKQAEAQRLAEIEAERLAKEEAEKVDV